jgi:hypothetical protein
MRRQEGKREVEGGGGLERKGREMKTGMEGYQM